ERLCARLNEIAAGQFEIDAMPAQVMAQSAAATGATPVIARAHHGSVSREERTSIEEALKSGRLPAVVATSSLELGIDMGAVDLVVQVESPPSVASGLQRVGRAGHQVGAVSRGVVFPKYRGDLVQTAVVVERMREGLIEALRYPRNPLDVRAQQIVAMVAMDDWKVDDLAEVVRRAAPFATLPASALEAVLDMLAGRYPSDEFAELRPRIVWDRVTSTLTGRPGAQRLAVTSGGTIPDRGLFGVFLVGEKASRVGELDEEMVYESRVGDVFTLGTTSWRIEDITHDRVLVSPAPGQPGKLPFWHGDSLGRPVELGRALGQFVRELGRLDDAAALTRAREAGLDEWAADNLVAYLREQRVAAGHLPDDRTIVVERSRDELGDWRVVVHSPFGAQVHAPWALIVAARARERFGVDVQAMHADDGIVLRLPDIETEDGSAPSVADLLVIEPEEVESAVTDEVGGSALFAARFRECAARALLMPRRDPHRRTPLWQQRQRASQLLSVASQYASFPIVLETVREVLQDVYDVPALVDLMRSVAGRSVRVVEIETPTPTPFAKSLLFGYVAQYLYEGDNPLAERRAAALSLDPTLLADLLGRAELRELLDEGALAEVEAELQRLTPDRQARNAEGIADLLRLLGPLDSEEVVARSLPEIRPEVTELLTQLESARRVIRVRMGGGERWTAIEDAGRLRDALGVALPVGVPEAFLEPAADPVGDLVSRYARTHGPFVVAAVSERLGLGPAVVLASLSRLAATGRVTEGEFRPGGTGSEWCDAEVLRRIRRRSLAALRKEAEPVPQRALAAFLPEWQGVGGSLRGLDGLVRVVEQLAGATVPASALETLVLPARLTDWSTPLLDELTVSGEVLWAGHGTLPGNDGWVSLHLADTAPLLLPEPDQEAVATPVHQAVLDVLGQGGAYFFRQLSDSVGRVLGTTEDAALVAAIWDLVWGGWLTNDTLAPLRALLGGGRTSHRVRASAPRGRISGRVGARPRLGRAGASPLPSRTGPPTVAGRWSLLPPRETDPTLRASAVTESLLDRHGVVTRGAVVAERVPGGFAAAYRVLTAFEDVGRARRGYVVEGLGGAQFSTGGAVDRLRAVANRLEAAAVRGAGADDPWDTGGLVDDWRAGRQQRGPASPAARARAQREDGEGRALVLAATDPAQPYGAALSWPDREDAGGHRPGRKAGALVVLVSGGLVLYVERGGKTLLSWTDDAELLQRAADALALSVRDGALGRLTVERADGAGVLSSTDSPLSRALETAGFTATPRGLRMRG
ncbi:MAG: Lhr family helicase, partial [Actinomycetales bacterium]